MADTPEALLERLAAAPAYRYPREVLTEIQARLPEMLPSLLAVLENALASPGDYEGTESDSLCLLPTFAAYFLAEAREKAAFPILTALLNLPVDEVELVFEDLIAGGMANILASVFDGREQLLRDLVENAEAYEFARSCGLGTYLCLLNHGLVSHEAVSGYFTELMRGRLEDDDQTVWSNLVCYCGDLGLAHLIPDIQTAYDSGKCDTFFTTEESVVHYAGHGGHPRWRRHAGDLIMDTIALTESWACFRPQPSAPLKPRNANIKVPQFYATPVSLTKKSAPKIGRNDPCPCASGKKYKKCCGA